MPGPIEFYFDFVSPFGWFGAERIGALARSHGRAVRWQPILLKATVLETMKLPALLDTPLKGPYIARDARRSAGYYGLHFSPEARMSFSPLNAARAVVWANLHAPDRVEPLVLALYRRHWSEAGDLSQPDQVLAVAADQGIDRDALQAGLSEPGIKTLLREQVGDAIARGVFGSPTVIVDGEMFWGADRFDMVAAWIERGGW